MLPGVCVFHRDLGPDFVNFTKESVKLLCVLRVERVPLSGLCKVPCFRAEIASSLGATLGLCGRRGVLSSRVEMVPETRR